MSGKIKYLAFAGKMQAGKTTSASMCADILVSLGYNVKRAAFAEALKDICETLFGIPWSPNDSDEDKNQLTELMWDGFPLAIREKYVDKSKLVNLRMGDLNWKNREVRDGIQKIVLCCVPFAQDEIYARSGPMTRREVWQVFGTDIMREMVDKDVWAKQPFQQLWTLDQRRTMVVIIDDLRYPNELEQARQHHSHIIKLLRDTGIDDNHISETALDHIEDDAFDLVIDNNGSKDELRAQLKDFLERHF